MPRIWSPSRCRFRRLHAARARAPTGFANIALLRRPADLDDATWRQRWHIDHTPVAIETQSTFGYTQNAVVRALTPAAPVIDAIVEELFPERRSPICTRSSAPPTTPSCGDRMDRMVASTSAFGANRDVDTVPTSRYVYPHAVRRRQQDGMGR